MADPKQFDSDPDPAFHFDSDPDSAFHFDSDPDHGTFCTNFENQY